MQFHSWSALIDEATKIKGKEWRGLSIYDKFREELRALIEYPFKNDMTRTKRIMRLCLELDWIRAGRPYYNVHPQMCAKLARTDLSKIPAQYIEIPNNYRSILVRFTDNIPIRILDGSQPMHVGAAPELQESPVGCRCALFGTYDFSNDPLVQEFAPDHVGEEQYVLIVDEGCRCMMGNNQRALLNTIFFGVRPEQTIPEAIEIAIDECDEVDAFMMLAMKERLENLFRTIITIGFLADAPEGILVPDILSAEQRKWDEAEQKGDTAKMDHIIAKSRRRGKLGWNVGTNEMFVAGHHAKSSPRGTGTGRELQWSHIRGGHPHAVRYGEGKKKVKIKWFRPTRVREDLPFKEE